MKKGAELEVIIDDYAFGGKGIVRLDVGDDQKQIIFVPNTIPGQKVKIRICKKEKKVRGSKAAFTLSTFTT